MPNRCFDWHDRIKAVEREYWSARRAIDRLSADVERDARALGEGPSPRDLRSADENLEGTYLIRMFAEFETGIRSFWRATRTRTHPRAEVLLNRVGVLRGVPADVIDSVHSARRYRNDLLHDSEGRVETVSVSQTQRGFQMCLARLPNHWGD